MSTPTTGGRAAPDRVPGPGAAWQALHLPDAEPAVRRAVLHRDGGGRSVQLVEFPAGWHRPAAGHFPVDEEFVVLRGSLELSGVAVLAGDHALVPAGALRADSAVGPEGCLAVAWFDGVPEWRRGAAPAPSGAIVRRRVEGVLLSEGGRVRPHPGPEVTGPADVLTTDGRWERVPDGAVAPVPGGDAVVRPWGRRPPTSPTSPPHGADGDGSEGQADGGDTPRWSSAGHRSSGRRSPR
ncbi:hypothetical protein [Geodermatophilus sp. SYSU D00766]